MTLTPFMQRTVSALLLGPLLLFAIIYMQGASFSMLLGVLLVPAAWEWGRIAGQTRIWPLLWYVVLVVALFYLSRFLPPTEWLLGVALIWWFAAFFWLRGFPEQTTILFGGVAKYVVGIIVLIPSWRSLELIHQQQHGVALLFLLLILIWSADTGAYLVGRKFGNNRLAPNVSPKKSIEGLFGGIGFALLAAIIAYPYLPKIDMGLPLFLLAVSGVVIFSVVGDLVESAYKRSAGLKDSGNLIPGHGGILDRMDSLTAAAPLFLSLFVVFGEL